jgi:Putative endonuclease segE, GIY-YIG domain
MWNYNNQPFEAPSESDYGFVYIITNLTTGRRYIGKKLFWFRKTRQVKGKKKRYLASSDWQDYWGSNDELKRDIEELGIDNFRRDIIYLCKNKGECSYMEAKLQFEHEVLRRPAEFYNSWIMLKVHRKHLVMT